MAIADICRQDLFYIILEKSKTLIVVYLHSSACFDFICSKARFLAI